MNGGDAFAILSDESLTQRTKRAILVQKDLTNKAALERLIRKGVGDEVFEEYYSGPEEEGSEDELDEDEGEDSEYEALMRPEERTPRDVTPVPGRVVPAPRRLRFRENDTSFGDPPEVEVVRPVEVNEINQHLEALHLGTPGQRRPNVSVEQVQSPRQLEFSVGGITDDFRRVNEKRSRDETPKESETEKYHSKR